MLSSRNHHTRPRSSANRCRACALATTVLALAFASICIGASPAHAVGDLLKGVNEVDGGFIYEARSIPDPGSPQMNGLVIERTDLASGFRTEVWRKTSPNTQLRRFAVRDGQIAVEYFTNEQSGTSTTTSQTISRVSPLGVESLISSNVRTSDSRQEFDPCAYVPRRVALGGVLEGGDIVVSEWKTTELDCASNTFRVNESVFRHSLDSSRTLMLVNRRVRSFATEYARNWVTYVSGPYVIVSGYRSAVVFDSDTGARLRSVRRDYRHQGRGSAFDIAANGAITTTRRSKGRNGRLEYGTSFIDFEKRDTKGELQRARLAQTRRYTYGSYCGDRPMLISHHPKRRDGVPMFYFDSPSTIKLYDENGRQPRIVFKSARRYRVTHAICTGTNMVVFLRFSGVRMDFPNRWVVVPIAD